MSSATPAEIHPVGSDRLDDLADLFATTGTTRGCWCMYHIAGTREFGAGYGEGNRAAFEALAGRSATPMGLLAYDAGRPVAWCAVGPRSRYQRAVGPRARILADRDRTEDDDVWLVTCFFTRVGYRRHGLTHRLLEAAVELAREHGATAVEGFPRTSRQATLDDYLGDVALFSSHGFDCVARPTAARVVMRRGLHHAER